MDRAQAGDQEVAEEHAPEGRANGLSHIDATGRKARTAGTGSGEAAPHGEEPSAEGGGGHQEQGREEDHWSEAGKLAGQEAQGGTEKGTEGQGSGNPDGKQHLKRDEQGNRVTGPVAPSSE